MSENKKDYIKEFLIERYHPGHSVDCVVFGYENHQIKILLMEWKYNNGWSLPGGFIFKNEDLDSAAYRILKDRTGLNSIFLSQFFTFGATKRNHQPNHANGNIQKLLKELSITNEEITNWFNKRFVTTGYLALTNIEKTVPKPDFLSAKCEWIALENIPTLLMDHKDIVDKALQHLKTQLNYLPIGLSLLPAKFTMQELQKLYEAILQKPLERSNFQRKMLKLDILIRWEKQMTGAANKAPYLYSFDKNKYESLIETGFGF